MPALTFETLTFRPNGSVLNVDLLRGFTASIPKNEVEAIAPFEIKAPHTIAFHDIPPEKAERRFLYHGNIQVKVGFPA